MATKLSGRLNVANIEALSSAFPEPDRVNEDTWLVLESLEPPDYVIAAVIDGAGARLTLPPLEEMLKERYRGLTAAAFAAGTARTSLSTQFAAHPDRSLSDALLSANQDLRRAVADALGGFSLELILEKAGLPPDDDPRQARLALPACVITLMRLNYSRQELEYAHAGDTSLLEIRRNGAVICHTSDQIGPYVQQTLRLAASLRRTKNLPHIVDAVNLPEVRQMDIETGLRHNYVDAQGHTQTGEGSGVINGLPELADYIECGTLAIDPDQTEGFCLLTDGLELLAPIEETATETEERLRQTGALLRTHGLRGLYEAVREMAELDPHHDQYPRIKTYDDATGVFLRLQDSI